MADSNSNKLFLTLLCSILIILVLKEKVSTALDADGVDISQGICSVHLKNILPPPYSDLSNLTCSRIWQQRFAFRDSKNVTTIVFSGKHEERWVGIGFSGDGKMVGSSAVVGWVGRDGVSRIKQYSLEGQTAPKVIPDKGNLRFTNTKPVVVLNGGILYMAFQLEFSTSLALQPILMAIGDGNPGNGDILRRHVDRTSTIIEFSSGHLVGQTTNANDLRRYHGVLGIMGWGILTPVGGMLARYCRHLDPAWYYLHSTTQFVGFFLGIIAISIGRHLYFQIHAVFPAHKFLGYSVFLLSALEVCQFMGRPSKDSKLRKYWNFGHYWIGRIATVLGVANIFVGLYIAVDVGLKIFFGIAFAALLISTVFFEQRHRKLQNAISTTIDEPPLFKPWTSGEMNRQK